MLPTPPPMIHRRFTFCAIDGSRVTAAAMFVSGACASTFSSPGDSSIRRTSSSTACAGSGRCVAFGKNESPIPSCSVTEVRGWMAKAHRPKPPDDFDREGMDERDAQASQAAEGDVQWLRGWVRGAKMKGEMRADQRISGDFEFAYAEGEAVRLRIVEDVAEAILHGDPTKLMDVAAVTREIPIPKGQERLFASHGENPVHELLYYMARLDYAAERMLWAVAEGDPERITQRASTT